MNIESFILIAEDLVQKITPDLNALVSAIIILFIGFIIGKIIGKITLGVLKDLRADEMSKKIVNTRISKGLSFLVSYIIYFASIIMALNALGVTTAVLTVLFGVVLLMLAVSFLLSIKDLLPNIIGGFKIRNGLFKEGDTIEFNSVSGIIESLNLTETRVRCGDDLLIIPNSLFLKTAVKRFSKKRRLNKVSSIKKKRH